MLFLNTLQVSAAYTSPIAYAVSTNNSVKYSNTVHFEVDSFGAVTGTIYGSGGNVTGQIITGHTYFNGSVHCKIPILLTADSVQNDIDNTLYYAVHLPLNQSISVNNDGLNNARRFTSYVKNIEYTDYEGNLCFVGGTYSGDYCNYYKGSFLNVLNQNVHKAAFPLYLEFDVSIRGEGPVGDYLGEVNINVTGHWDIYGLSSTAQDSLKTYTSDSVTHEQLEELNTSSRAIEESVTSDTGGGILATIKNFFGSFFQNVFDTLVSVFVPEDGFFSDWFNRLNTLLSEKLGMLYAPFDLLITTLNAIMNADSTETGIPFPGIQWEDTYLVEPFTFYFSSLGDTFKDLQGYVYFATDTVLLFAFLYLLQNKIRLILEGHESG